MFRIHHWCSNSLINMGFSHSNSERNTKVMLILFIVIVMSPSTFSHPEVQYLLGVHRLNDSGYIDYYFYCNAIGDFLQWTFNGSLLIGFRVEDAGVPRSHRGPMVNYTAILLPLQFDHRLGSLFVISFPGEPEFPFDVECSNNTDYATTQVEGLRGTIKGRNSSRNHQVMLDHILSVPTGRNRSVTDIFICGARNDSQLFTSGQSIEFTEHDGVDEVRNAVNLLDVPFATEPYEITSLLIVLDSSNVTAVMCFSGPYKVQLNLSQDENELPTDSQEVPVNNSTTSGNSSSEDLTTTMLFFFTTATSFRSNSSEDLTTTMLSYFTTDSPSVSNKVAVHVGIMSAVVLVVVVAGAVVLAICLIYRHNRAPTGNSPEDGGSGNGTSNNSPEAIALDTAESPPPEEEAPPVIDDHEQRDSGGEGSISGELISSGECKSGLVLKEPGGLLADGKAKDIQDVSGLAEKSLCGQDSVWSLPSALHQSGYTFLDCSSFEGVYSNTEKRMEEISLFITKVDFGGTCGGDNYQADPLLILVKAVVGILVKAMEIIEAAELIFYVVQHILVVFLFIQGLLLCIRYLEVPFAGVLRVPSGVPSHGPG